MRRYNPSGIAAPASNYSQGVAIRAESRRVVVSGQIGVKPDGTLEQSSEDQMRRCWTNLFAVLAEEGLGKEDLIKVTVFLTRPQDVSLYRQIRDEMLEGHAPASTLLIVAGLAMPELTVEIEGEAVG
ncbi:MAG: RidA family protein [Alphaproteobacteria bacterium]|nr:RidA family protein [Alphaproteobacteria bacterium]